MGNRARGLRELIVSREELLMSGHTLTRSALLSLASCFRSLLWQLGFYTVSIFRSGAQWLLGQLLQQAEENFTLGEAFHSMTLS